MQEPVSTHPRLTKEELAPIVRAAATGEAKAVNALVTLLTPSVTRYCRARLGGRDLGYVNADDVAQEVCLAVLKALPQYHDRGGSFLYLVHAIASNKVADAFRMVSRDRSDPVPELPEMSGLSGDNEPERHALGADLGERLAEKLRLLTPVQQEIVTLRLIIGLSATETAEAIGISPGNVRTTQHRALAKLRQLIEQEKEF
ncbi:sigma-70 family RNA polymerase sigma factor [Amycolatopsis suaedae]|uniref:Sigma-70 family RNA polymerase sigma factor n=1 Tax=Amycolatopsis suaedae TaxID=2510978 RepID=A0A4Q7J049_9PSEU|nr:sigma-70 family RNA polymerase sigma factor [Amycolatopsis suaedae]